MLHPEWVEARLEVGLPAAGRRVLGGQAISLLTDAVPEVALAGAWRMRSQELSELREIVEQRQEDFERAWNEHFSGPP